jgi:hypothetical protein
MNGAGLIYEAVITEINTHEPVAYVRKDILKSFARPIIFTRLIQTTRANP